MIIVDSNRQVIDYSNDLSIKLRKCAEKRRELSHYCSIDVARKILQTQKLLFKCVNEYTSYADKYEKDWIDEEYRKIIFLNCMTHGVESEDFWIHFADDGHGVKLTFRTKDIFHKEIIDTSKYIEAYNSKDEVCDYFASSISCLGNCFSYNSNLSSDIITEILLTDVNYDIKPLDTVYNINAQKYLDLSSISRVVKMDYEKEYETRMIAILRSTKPIAIKYLSYLLVPLDFRKVDLKITYGNKVTEKEKHELEMLRQVIKN